MVVDFLATLFATFCIGVAAALVLGACVVLMAGDAHGAAPVKAREAAVPAAAAPAAADLLLAHYFASKYAGLLPIDRIAATGEADQGCARGEKARAGKPCLR
jgi:hypothetical protein